MKSPPKEPSKRPRLGFAGTGWIGRHRLEALLAQDIAEVVAVAEPAELRRREIRTLTPSAALVKSFDELLEHSLDGVVIATPSAMHAAQASAALERQLAVFCQKPLARNAQEAAAVVSQARRVDQLLGVDLSYRYTEAVRTLKGLLDSGELGSVYSLDLTFHNAYGPDKQWYYSRSLAGGGALADLGVHLVDLALWLFDFPQLSELSCQLRFAGKSAPARESNSVEDFASLQFTLDDCISTRLACSWHLPAGTAACISVAVYGTGGGARIDNVNGSFYDFELQRLESTRSWSLTSPPDAWGGRALCEWARKLRQGCRFDASAERYVEVHRVLDSAYQKGGL